MASDIYQKLRLDFGNDVDEAWEEIRKLDARTKGYINDNMVRAIIFLANGNMDSLKQIIEEASFGYKEVLRKAEYDGSGNRIYDFDKNFNELGLIKKKK